MSALPSKADIDDQDCHLHFVPKADIHREAVVTELAARLTDREPAMPKG
jgi:hypothetical protein